MVGQTPCTSYKNAKEMSTDCSFHILGPERERGVWKERGRGGSSSWGQGSIFFFLFSFKIGFIACFYSGNWGENKAEGAEEKTGWSKLEFKAGYGQLRARMREMYYKASVGPNWWLLLSLKDTVFWSKHAPTVYGIKNCGSYRLGVW